MLELDRVYRSTDNGATWVLVNNGLPTSNGGQAFSLLAVGNTVYVGFFLEGVYSTSDSGANWIPNRNGLPTQSTPWTLYADGTNLYAGIGFTTGISSGVYRATIAP